MSGWLLFWAALAVLFGAGEAIGRTLRLAPFALAAVGAAGGAWAGADVGVQWTVYAVAAALLSLLAPWVARRVGL